MKRVRVIIELDEYSITQAMNEKLQDYSCAGKYDDFNRLLQEIIDNYTPIRRIPNIYYLQ